MNSSAGLRAHHPNRELEADEIMDLGRPLISNPRRGTKISLETLLWQPSPGSTFFRVGVLVMAATATLGGIPILLETALERIVIVIISGKMLEGTAFDGDLSQTCKWSLGTLFLVRIPQHTPSSDLIHLSNRLPDRYGPENASAGRARYYTLLPLDIPHERVFHRRLALKCLR